MKKFLFLTLITGCLSVITVMGIVSGNDSCGIFEPLGCNTGGNGGSETGNTSYTQADITLGRLITEGAANFTLSYSYTMRVSNLIELSELEGLNDVELRECLYSAIKHMELSAYNYYVLVQVSTPLKYKEDVKSKLEKMEYLELKDRKGIHSCVFDSVVSYLSVGDVKGVYQKFYNDSSNILGILYDIKKNVDNNLFPEIESIWRLNQGYSESLLFGQFVTEVFKEIQK